MENEVRNTDAENRRFIRTCSGGLIAISVIILQAFITADKLDQVETASVTMLALTIPMLAICFLYCSLEMKAYTWDSNHPIDRLFASGAIFTLFGIGLAFYHVSWITCVAFGVSSLIIIKVYMQLIK